SSAGSSQLRPPGADGASADPFMGRKDLPVDIDHVGIAVADLEAAVHEYERSLGLQPVHRERVEDQGVEEVLFAVGTSYVQLLGALAPDTPVGKFLAKRGEGIHHVGYRVPDVAAMLDRL